MSVTAIDTKAGTITVEGSTLRAFDSFLKTHYRPEIIQNFVFAKTAEIDAMYEQIGDSLAQSMWGVTRTTDATRLAGCKIGSAESPLQLSAAGIVALTTFAGLEWLRHRKAEVAAAGETGDFSSLIADFFAWFRALSDAWRESMRHGSSSPCSDDACCQNVDDDAASRT